MEFDIPCRNIYRGVTMAVDLTEKKDGGVLKEILREGEGDATPGESCTVYVHYHGTLQDGTVFDSSRDRGTEFDFQLGTGQVSLLR